MTHFHAIGSYALVLHLQDMNNITFHGRRGSAVFMRPPPTPLGRRFAHFPENSLGSVWQKTVFGCQVELQIMVSQFKVDF